MKKIILILMAASMGTSLWAQDKESVEKVYKVRYGIEAGGNLARFSGNAFDKISSVGGFKVGGIADMPFLGGLSLQPGLFYSLKGAKADGEKATLGYLEIPVNLSLRLNVIDFGFILVNAGVYGAYGVNSSGVTFGGSDVQLKSLDAGLNFGAGYLTTFGLFGKLQYQKGITNLSHLDGVSVHNSVLSITVGYLIP